MKPGCQRVRIHRDLSQDILKNNQNRIFNGSAALVPVLLRKVADGQQVEI